MKSIILILVFGVLFNSTQQYNNSREIIDEMEIYVRNGAERVQQLFEQRCTEDVSECLYQIYSSCTNTIPSGSRVHRTDIQVEGCSSAGLMLNFETTAGRCQNSEGCNSEFDKRLICSLGRLFEDSLFEDQEPLVFQPNDKILYSYAGFQNSFFLQYPFYHTQYDCSGDCEDYDPRIRPWYMGAATGPKNIMLIADISGSMYGRKLEKLKEALIYVINSLRNYDYFQVILLQASAVQIHEGFFYSGSAEYKQQIIQKIEDLQIQDYGGYGNTNFYNAFQKAFTIFEESKRAQFYQNGCQNLILFFSDGYISTGTKDVDELNESIATWNQDFNAIIMTYSIGVITNDNIMQKIACFNNGLWSKIEIYRSDLQKILSNYALVSSQGLQTNEVVWSEIYKDYSINLDVMTASHPIYYNDNGVQRLLGVFGADIMANEMKQFQDFESEYFQITTKLQVCQDKQFSNCEIQKFTDTVCENHQCTNLEEEETICENQPFIEKSWINTKGLQIGRYYSICEYFSEQYFQCQANILQYFAILGYLAIVLIY